ncbi:hypothetical protein [Pseudothermotoga sp.]|uniref:ABC transporter substrate-binding protein n=1 Tax=Pseudothermotoga sp. TaxID=2033661 RepID=UPI0031F6DF23
MKKIVLIFLFISVSVVIVLLTQLRLDKPVIIILDDGEARFQHGVRDFLNRRKLSYEVQIVRIDTGWDKLEATLKKFSNNYSIGPRLSSQAYLLLPILEENRIFTIAPLVTSNRVVGKSQYLMSLAVTDEEQGEQIAKRILAHGKTRVLFICDRNNPVHNQTLREGLEKHLPAPFETVEISEVEELLNSNFSLYDAIVLSLDGKKAGLIAQLIRSKNFDGLIIGSDYVFTEDLIKSGKQSVEDMLVCCLYDYEVMRIQGIDDMQVAGAFDAAMVIAELVQNRVSTEKAAEYLKDRKFNGITGQFVVTSDLSTKRQLTFLRIRNGKFEVER